ncbi:hypothetical protein F4778DRAFT_759759 [Xylariomycetidae sp. FL2044]|nr:hypothetical protein F4778DRAFT_759759 [Xylariomycetidae sp. FL2044]
MSNIKSMDVQVVKNPSGTPNPQYTRFTTALDWLSRFAGIDFFASSPYFEPNPNAPFEDEFRRFSVTHNLTPQQWRVLRTRAIDRELVYHYFSQKPSVGDEGAAVASGVDERQLLKGYQDMARAADTVVDPVAEECWRCLVFVPVDIIGLIDFRRTGQRPARSIEKSTVICPKEAKAGSGILSSLHPNCSGVCYYHFRFKPGAQVNPPWWNKACKEAKLARNRARRSGAPYEAEKHAFQAAIRAAKRAYNEEYGATFRL